MIVMFFCKFYALVIYRKKKDYVANKESSYLIYWDIIVDFIFDCHWQLWTKENVTKLSVHGFVWIKNICKNMAL